MKLDKFKEEETNKCLKRMLQAKEVHSPEGFSSRMLERIRDEEIRKILATTAKNERRIILATFVIFGALTFLALSSFDSIVAGSRLSREFLSLVSFFGSEMGTNYLSFIGLGVILVYIAYILVDLLLVE